MDLNIGTSINFWIVLLKAAVMTVVLVKLGIVVAKYIYEAKWNKYASLVFWGIVTVLVAVIMFIGYGRGDVDLQSVEGDKIGMTELQEEVGPENVDSARAITEDAEPEPLKRQRDGDFEEEAKQADEYLKSIGVE